MDCRNNAPERPRALVLIALAVLLVTFGLTINSIAQAEPIPKKYLQLVPGVSTRADVSRIFPAVTSEGVFVEYEGNDLVVRIEFSPGNCELPLGWGKLPAGTIERISYEWPEERQVGLRDVLLNPTRFRKERHGDVTIHDYYVNDELGIKVVYDRKWKRVLGIDLEPSRKLKQQFAC